MMESRLKNAKSIDEYISLFPENIRDNLIKLRNVIKDIVPEAEETISYQMPTFKLNGNLVHFAAFKDHIGFFPTPSVITKFKKELSGYGTSKGTIRFPLNEPLPFSLIRKIVKFRVDENLAKSKKK